MVKKLSTVLALTMLVLALACADEPTAPPSTDRITHSRVAQNDTILEPVEIVRFDVELHASGTFMPWGSIVLSASARSSLAPVPMSLSLIAPEVEAARLTSWTRPGFHIPVDRKLPVLRAVQGAPGVGGVTHVTYTLRIPEPGVYRVVATAQPTERLEASAEDRLIQDVTHETLWLWIGDASPGAAFRTRPDPRIVPEVPSGLGPRGKVGATEQGTSAASAGLVSSFPDQLDAYAKYYDQDAFLYRALSDVKVFISYQERDEFGTYPLGTDVQQTNSSGRFWLDCSLADGTTDVAYSGYIEPENSDVKVREWIEKNNWPDEHRDLESYIQGDLYEDCDLSWHGYEPEHVGGPARFFHVFREMTTRTIPASRRFFGYSRGKIEVAVEIDETTVGSHYSGFYDRISLNANGVWKSLGVHVMGHEYGHAFHEKGLNGNAASGNCPGDHFFGGAHNVRCAYSEGFAQYHAAVVGGPAGSRYSAIVNRTAYPAWTGDGDRSNGALIEGAVGAFLFDVTDSADDGGESFDAVTIVDVYPGLYVAELIRSCMVHNGSGWIRADGIDHIIACLEMDPVESGLWDTYFDFRSWPFRAFDASYPSQQPQGYPPRSSIRTLWTYELFTP